MNYIITTLIVLVLSTCLSTGILFWSFAAVGSFKRLYEDTRLWGITPFAMKVTAVVCALLGLIADPIFNWTRGAWIFREWPWEHRTLMFTHRVQWHIDHSHGWRYAEACNWGVIGNTIMPGHFKRF